MKKRDDMLSEGSRCVQLRRLLNEMQRIQSGDPETGVPRNDAAASTGGTTSSASKPTILVDVGNHVYCQCELKSDSDIWVNVGCGIVVPMTREEAFRFLVKKESLSRQNADRMSKEVLRVKYRIRLVLEAIRRLHEIRLRGGNGGGTQ